MICRRIYLLTIKEQRLMMLKNKVKAIVDQIKVLKDNPKEKSKVEMPGKAYFIDDNNILTIPRDDGDSRYPYTSSGFTLWTYTSGYMYANEGAFYAFLPAREGQEPGMAFFAGEREESGEYSVKSLLSIPETDSKGSQSIERYTIFSKNAAYYITELDKLRYTVRVFAGECKEIVFSIIAENMSDEPQKIFISSFFNPFLKYSSSDDPIYRWWKESRVINTEKDTKELPIFLFKVNEDINRTAARTNYCVVRRIIKLDGDSKLIRHEETTARYQYVGGTRRSLQPSALRKGTFGEVKNVCGFTDVAIAGDIITVDLEAGGTARVDIKLNLCFNDSEKDSILEKSIHPGDIDKEFLEKELKEKEKEENLTAAVGDFTNSKIKKKVFNAFFEHLKKQVEFCALGKNYAGPMIGVRDIFQALEGSILWLPEASKNKILEALEFVSPNGRCPRQYSLPLEDGQHQAMDLRPFIDQGAWVLTTIIAYLRLTKDFALLDEKCGYYEIVDEKAKKVQKSQLSDSVLQHMIKITDYLVSNRDHEITKCVCALYGDWNDALDGLGVSQDRDREYGTGVSVMASLQVYRNLEEMIELLNLIDSSKYSSLISKYESAKEEIRDGLFKHAVVESADGEKRILHGWGDKRSYFVGGFKDPDGQSRIGLTSNAFWVLSGLYDMDIKLGEVILNTFEKLDSKYGLKTFEPYFAENTSGVGRISKLPAGTAENAAAYIHASMFGIAALFRMGLPEKAWEQLEKSLPFTHEYISCSPFIMPNSYCHNEDKNIDGESMSDWHTGSSNVLLKTLVRYVFGIEPHYDGLWVQPAAWMPFEKFKFSINIRGCNVCINYCNQGNEKREFVVNGIKRNTEFDKFMKIHKLWISDDELNVETIVINITD
jgi:cellobiose phosphorylase